MRGIRDHVLYSTTVVVVIIVGSGFFVAQSLNFSDAPTGFSTPTLNRAPGSLSTSNGIPEPSGDTFAVDQSHFEESEGNDTGLGPVYNATSCASCHQSPVTG